VFVLLLGNCFVFYNVLFLISFFIIKYIIYVYIFLLTNNSANNFGPIDFHSMDKKKGYTLFR